MDAEIVSAPLHDGEIHFYVTARVQGVSHNIPLGVDDSTPRSRARIFATLCEELRGASTLTMRDLTGLFEGATPTLENARARVYALATTEARQHGYHDPFDYLLRAAEVEATLFRFKDTLEHQKPF